MYVLLKKLEVKNGAMEEKQSVGFSDWRNQDRV